MIDIWREKVSVRFKDVDRSGRLTLEGIFGFFQEAATSHAEDLGVGLSAIKKTGQAWVLSRFSLFVEYRPAYEDVVQISTWPRQWEKLFALRDYEIRDRNDRVIVRGRAGWLVLDIEKRRPLRVESLINSIPPNEGIDAFPRSGNSALPAGLEEKEKLEKITTRTACYSDVDYYGHVNNARYIQWMQDVTDMDILTRADQERLDINYLSEVKPGEIVELWMAPFDTVPDAANGETGAAVYPSAPGPAFAYEGKRPGSPNPVFRAELRIGNN